MSVSLASLLGYVAWTLFLTFIFVAYRGLRVMSGQNRANDWTRGRAVEDPGFVKRTTDARDNCLEMLPLFAAVVLVAVVSGSAAVTNGLACWFLAARIGQSVSHMISISHWMIFLARFPLFLIQLLILVWWLWGFATLN